MGYSNYATYECYIAPRLGTLKKAVNFHAKEIVRTMLELSFKEEADEFSIYDNGNSLTGSAEFTNEHDDLFYLRLQKISLLNRMLVFDFEAKNTWGEYERVMVTNGIIWRGAGEVVYEKPDLKKIFTDVPVENEDPLEGLTEDQLEAAFRKKEHDYRVQDALYHILAYFGMEEGEEPEDPEEFEKEYGYKFEAALKKANTLADQFIEKHDCNIDENTQWDNLVSKELISLINIVTDDLTNKRGTDNAK